MAIIPFLNSKPIQFYNNPKNHEALGDFRENDKVQRLIKITKGWYTITEKPSGIYLNDLRFGKISMDPNSDKYAFSFLIEKDGNDVKITEEPKQMGEGKALISDLWERIKGN